MAAYEYAALDTRGRQQKGLIEGDTPRQVRQLLRDRGLTPLDIHEVSDRKSRGGPATGASTTMPRSRSARRFSGDNTAPPPVAMTILGRCEHASSTWRSLLRNPCSPSISKITGMRTPQRASSSWSRSINSRCSVLARPRPTVVLPEPIMPTRKMGWPVAHAGEPDWAIRSAAVASAGWCRSVITPLSH